MSDRIRTLLPWILAGIVSAASFTFAGVSAQSGAARRYILTPDRRPDAPYSNAVLIGDTLYLAGRTGSDRQTGKVPEDLEREIRTIMDGMKLTLETAGMTMDDLVMVEVHCPDVALYDKFNAVYLTYFGKNLPARAFLGSGPLLRGAHFEILGVAVKR